MELEELEKLLELLERRGVQSYSDQKVNLTFHAREPDMNPFSGLVEIPVEGFDTDSN